ncbi:hypothetical protein [Sphingomonas corticis]|uniref:Uncharacterized protein n=1 Tax=Sphingomonas corticis TaxID=2722791 RepID=A0ABX1CMF3_9SPHN|nr:hypothetical protein [Sphingomonas corticis]NJR79161.1 hypothetical protein [Sphingomonas corticis]
MVGLFVLLLLAAIAGSRMMGELRVAGSRNGPTVRINIGDLIQEGRKLCG